MQWAMMDVVVDEEADQADRDKGEQ